MLILELGEIVDVLVDDDVEVGGLVMRCDIALAESFGHGEGMKRSIYCTKRIPLLTPRDSSVVERRWKGRGI
jgi:hypothetical protein